MGRRLSCAAANVGAVRALNNTSGLVQGVRAFEQAFLRAGVKHYPSRERYAEIALAAFQATGSGVQASGALGGGYPASLLAEAARASETPVPMTMENNVADASAYAERSADPSIIGVLAVDQPVIHDTVAWGTRPPSQAITVLTRRPKGIVIHHTTHPNTSETSLAHAFSIARGIQDFHMGPERKSDRHRAKLHGEPRRAHPGGPSSQP